jgi:hypothetical protein
VPRGEFRRRTDIDQLCLSGGLFAQFWNANKQAQIPSYTWEEPWVQEKDSS